LTIIGQLGDFFESLQKRSIDTQDSYRNLLEILFHIRKEVIYFPKETPFSYQF